MNKVILIGRFGKDPEVKTTSGGNNVAAFAIAVDRDYRAGDGNRITDWISCTAWKKTADFIGKYFHKGDKILVEGSLQTRSYEAQDGSKRNVCDVVVNHCEFVDGKGNKEQTQNTGTGDWFVEYDDDSLPF